MIIFSLKMPTRGNIPGNETRKFEVK